MSKLQRAIPVLLSTDVRKTLDFFKANLGFEIWMWGDDCRYGGASRDGVDFHISHTDDANCVRNSSCRFDVDDVGAIHSQAEATGCIHPNGALADKPWGYREFAILEPGGILVWFGQDIENKIA